MGKGVIDERHPRFLGTAALSADDFIHCAIDRADLIINVGHDVIEKPPFFMEHDGNRKVIHINNFSADVDEVYFPQLELVGDIASTIQKLTESCSDSSWDLSYFQRVKDEVESHLTKYFEDDRFPILPQRVVKILCDTLDYKDIVTLDNGVYKIWFARNYKAYGPSRLLLDNALATMGAGLPSAMAAKLVKPDRKVVAVVGDGGFMMNSQELEVAVREKLDLTVIILNDNSYGMIRWKQEGMGFEDWGLQYNNPDFVKYAESYGARGFRPKSVEEFIQDLDECVNSGGVDVIDLSVDYSLNHKILNVLIKEKACLI
jgi:acetolactate synthase-1/2/3 large subunit